MQEKTTRVHGVSYSLTYGSDKGGKKKHLLTLRALGDIQIYNLIGVIGYSMLKEA